MTIKKNNGAAPAEGSVAINDRLRLNTTPVATTGLVSAKATKYAFVAALVALAVTGVLTYILYKHWEFLMPA